MQERNGKRVAAEAARSAEWHLPLFRILVPTLLTVCLFVMAFYLIAVPNLRHSLMNAKYVMIHELATAVFELLTHYNQRVLDGELTLEESQRRAMERIRAMRYGPERKDYFWINDLTPRMIMHPYLPELEGRDVTEYRDREGKPLFKNFVRVVTEHGEGYTDYLWQRHDDPSQVGRKHSFVQLFEPWGWIVGTGIYLDDLNREIAAIQRTQTRVFAVIMIAVLMATGYSTREWTKAERSRMVADVGRHRLAEILEQSVDAVALANPDGELTYLNRAGESLLGCVNWRTGANMRDILPQSVHELLQQEGLPVAFEKGVWTIETEAQSSDGSCIPVHLTLMAHKEESSVPAFLSLTLRDLRKQREDEQEKRRLEEQVRYAQKLESLGLLAGGIAHDFNNILLAILGNASYALKGIPPSNPIRPAMEDIETAALRGADLTKQMLAYAGKGKLSVESVNLNETLTELVRILSASISKKAELKYDLDRECPWVEGDATQIRQVMMNLITNASEALYDQPGTITVRTRIVPSNEVDSDLLPPGETLAARYALIEVRDTGCGMSEETRRRIFDPFFTTKFTGRGLGLAAVIGIVRGHHGLIQVDSAPGQGSAFRIFLPTVKAPSAPASRQQSQLSKANDDVKGTVLLVDDEPAVLALGRRIL